MPWRDFAEDHREVLGSSGEEMLKLEVKLRSQGHGLSLPDEQSLKATPFTAKPLWGDARLLLFREEKMKPHPMNCCRAVLDPPGHLPVAPLGVAGMGAGSGGGFPQVPPHYWPLRARPLCCLQLRWGKKKILIYFYLFFLTLQRDLNTPHPCGNQTDLCLWVFLNQATPATLEEFFGFVLFYFFLQPRH